MATIDDFKKLDFRVGTIKEVKDHPDADKLLVLTIDVGGETREVVAGIKLHYKPEELAGKQCIVAFNLDPATIRGVESQGMALAAKDDKGFALLTLDRPIQSGTRVS